MKVLLGHFGPFDPAGKTFLGLHIASNVSKWSNLLLKMGENFCRWLLYYDGFIFKKVNQEEVRQEITNLDGSKATTYGDRPANILKSSINIHLDFLTDTIKKSFRESEFPNLLKYAEPFPVNKKKDHIYRENCRPVSVLSQKSKRFEK